MTAAIFPAAFAAYITGPWVGDYSVQTNAQAPRKGLPGWPGHRACAAHVATYTLTLAASLALAWGWLDLPVHPVWAAAGLAVSAVTHPFADRRRPLRWLAGLIPGKLAFWQAGDGLASGGAFLDQAWHRWWLFAPALITAGAR
jgi:hypothetical protein